MNFIIIMKKHYLLFASFVFALNVFAQNNGCTDPYAKNYNSKATINNGSCAYETVVLDPNIIIDELPSTVEETSGIIYFNDAIWTHNDSGGEPIIYKIEPISGDIIQKISLSNGTNFDMEDITQDHDYIYLGDFGNNYGTRQDLTIYKIKKTDIPDSGDTSVIAELITFSFNDQDNFEKRNRNNNFDCESMASIGDHLYVFTKNWVDQKTKCYKMPKTPGDYQLDIFWEFNVRGLLTGADYNAENNTLILVGYENFVPYMWSIWDFKGDQFDLANKKRVEFAYIQGAQTEGICFIDQHQIRMSCEGSFFPPRIYGLKLNEVISNAKNSSDYHPFKIELQSNLTEATISINIEGLIDNSFDVEVYNLSWQKIQQYSFEEPNFSSVVSVKIPSKDIGNGIFFFRIKEGNRIGFQKLIIN